MTKIENNRVVQEMPRNFDVLKRDFIKTKNLFLARSQEIVQEFNEETAQDEIKETPTRAYALLWALKQELDGFFYNQEAEMVEKMKEDYDENNVDKYIFPEYNKVIYFDDDAQFYFQRGLNQREWQEYDFVCNEREKAKHKK